MSEVFGTVQRVVGKQRGNGTAYSVQMDDGEWYGHGFQQPAFTQGAQIGFDIAWNGQYKNIDVGSVQVHQAGQPQQQAPQQQQGGGQQLYNKPRGGGNSGGGGGREKYWDDKAKDDKIRQKQIQWQAARNTSIEFVKMAIENGAVKLPAKQAEKFEALLALVDEVARDYYRVTAAFGKPQQAAQQAQQQQPEQGQQTPEPDFPDDDIPF